MGSLKSQKRHRVQRSLEEKRSNTQLKKLRDVEFATQYLESLLQDAKYCLPRYRSADLEKDIAELHKRVDTQGLPFLTDVLPTLITGLFDQLEGREATFTHFKVRENRPEFLQGLFYIASSGNVAEQQLAIQFIYTVSVAFKKLRGSYKREKLRQQFLEFVEVDQSLPELSDLSPEAMRILNTAKVYMEGILGDIDTDGPSFRPRPGPGATNIHVPKNRRYRPAKLFSQVEEHMSFWDGWYTSTPWDLVLQSGYYMKLLKKAHDNYPVSRFKFVPKTYGKARGICIEENEVQFLQQALRRGMTQVILKDPYLSRHIPLNDQGVNAKLALQSSKDRSYATIDMSEASDRISRSIVEFLTNGIDLGPKLLCLSTRYIQPPDEWHNKDLIETKKFAPMGSALCFPVMSLVHHVLVKAIIRLTCHDASYDTADDIYIFGDDMIIPSEVYQSVTERLPWFGMKLNLTKSFVHSHFRESCGIHAYYGEDITPVYIRCIPTSPRMSDLQTHFATESQLDSKCWYNAAKCYREWVNRTYRRKFPEVPCDSPLVGFLRRPQEVPVKSAHNRATAIRWNIDYGILEYKLDCFHVKLNKLPMWQRDAYLKWHLMTPIGGVHSPLNASIAIDSNYVEDAIPGVVISQKWVSASACGHRAL